MEKWEYACQHGFERANDIKKKWKDYHYFDKMIECGIFYQIVFANGSNPSGLISKEAFRNKKVKKPTCDHWMPARLFYMAMMEIYPELLNDSKKFKELFRELCQSTIKITEHQNDIVKFKNSIDEGIRIKYLSIEKYEKCKDDKDNIGIEFFNEGNGSYTLSKYDFVTGFPLKELVPEWITEFESQYVVEE